MELSDSDVDDDMQDPTYKAPVITPTIDENNEESDNDILTAHNQTAALPTKLSFNGKLLQDNHLILPSQLGLELLTLETLWNLHWYTLHHILLIVYLYNLQIKLINITCEQQKCN